MRPERDAEPESDEPEPLKDWYPEDAPYDRERFHDRSRGWLAAATLGLLALVVIAALAVAGFFPSRWEAFNEALDKILAPVTGFAGLALAYFFGRGRDAP